MAGILFPAIEVPRRAFLSGAFGLVCAPAVIRLVRLMPVRTVPAPPMTGLAEFLRTFPAEGKFIAKGFDWSGKSMVQLCEIGVPAPSLNTCGYWGEMLLPDGRKLELEKLNYGYHS